MNGVAWLGFWTRSRFTRKALPKNIPMDNGTDFTSKLLDQWADLPGVRPDFRHPGKPTDNGLVEALNRRPRSEYLNENWLSRLNDAKEKVG